VRVEYEVMAALLAQYQNQFLLFVLILTRVSGLVASAPVLGLKGAPLQVRIVLAMSLAVLVTPFHWHAASSTPAHLIGLVLLLGQEILLGLALGLSIHVLFTGLHICGQVMGQLSGLALAEVFDPSQEASVPVLSDLMDKVTLAVFVVIGGHRQLMQVLLDTFRWMPPGKTSFGPSLVEALTDVTTLSLTLGVRAAAPALVALLLANLILGLISRTLPQLNVMALGFGINILVMLAVLGATLTAIVWLFQDASWDVMETMREALGNL
jgi:flagellar biosynthetic protein FliR